MGRHSRGLSGSIKELTPRHRSMVRAIAAGGLTPTQLCKIYDMSASQMSKVINSPAFTSELFRLEGRAELNSVELQSELVLLRDQALRNVADDLTMDVGDDPRSRELRQKASLAALEMTGLRNRGGVIISGDMTFNQQNNQNLTLEQLSRDVFSILEATNSEG